MELTLFELFDWKVLVVCAIGTSFIVGAIDAFTPEGMRARYILPLVSMIVVFLNTTFVPQAKFADWQNLAFQFLFNASAAILFYISAGKWTVDKVMTWIKSKIDNKINKDITP
jgi:Na+/H+ antiporter NhaC